MLLLLLFLLLLLMLLFLRCSSASRSVNSNAEMSESPKYDPGTLLTQFKSLPEEGNNNTLTETSLQNIRVTHTEAEEQC